MKTAVRTTRNDLPAKTRRAMAALLNRQLADLVDAGLQAKQAHWNVQGPSFITLHELFDRVAEELDEAVDTVAERAVALGGTALGTVQTVHRATRLVPYPTDARSGRAHLDALSDALGAVGATTRTAIDTAARAGDADTADVFTEVSRGLDKLLWLLEAHGGARD